ncbi:MAG: hypothetical protein GY830_09605 [Bacteroidetes bacterium]|nr:hypothetical protein [Bacteroidota bacterium]
MVFKNLGDISVKLARSPLGIITLAFVLVYAIAGLLIVNGNLQPNERIIFVWFLVIFPCIVIAVFYLLVSKHNDKLYAPSDFTNEEHFVNILESKIEQSPKLNKLEDFTKQIKKEINNQPLYRYTKLSESGKILTLQIFSDNKINLQQYVQDFNFEKDEVKNQAQILAEYGWVINDNINVKITEKGKKEINTFEDICYARLK